MKLFNGKKAAQKILKELAVNIKKEKLRPGLAVILVGDDEASKLYIKLKKEAAKKVGIEVSEFNFSRQVRQEEVINKIKELNQEKTIHGIIVQLPLPAIFNIDAIIQSIDSKKDVDGFHQENIRRLEKGETGLEPVLPSAILLALEEIKRQAAPQEAPNTITTLALVNSDSFGQSLKMVLKKEGGKFNYLVRNVCVVKGAEKEVAAADVFITACGCPKFIKGDMIKHGAVLIDAGITRFSDGKIVGDIDQESVSKKASYLTPVPGGIGPLTVALLLRNVYLSAKGK